jgi:hypothetical protein
LSYPRSRPNWSNRLAESAHAQNERAVTQVKQYKTTHGSIYGFSITSAVHCEGINIRHIGRVRACIRLKCVCARARARCALSADACRPSEGGATTSSDTSASTATHNNDARDARALLLVCTV